MDQLEDRSLLTAASLSISASVAEGGTAYGSITLDEPSDDYVYVSWSTSDGTAQAGSDYYSASGTSVFAPGDTYDSIAVSTINDNQEEGNEYFAVHITGVSGDAFIGSGDDTVTIIDNDQPPPMPTIQVSFASSVAEGGSIIVNATLSSATDDPVSLPYSTSDGTATAPLDYYDDDGTLYFAPGQTSASFSISTVNDDESEGTEYFHLDFGTPTNATFGSSSSNTISIQDNDQPPPTPTLSLSATSSVNEGGTVYATITLNPASDETISVYYHTVNGSAVAPDDYSNESDTAVFTPGMTSYPFTISTANDSDIEGDETFSISLLGPVSGNAVIGAPSSSTVLIIDDDAPPPTPYIRLSAASSVTEGGSVYVTVTIDPPSSQSVSVHYSTSDATAIALSDYEYASGDLYFAPGQTSQGFPISTIDDAEEEPTETFDIGLSDATGAELGSPSSAVISILDNDSPPPTPTIHMNVGPPVTEGDTATVTVTVDPPSNDWVYVNYATSDDTATAGNDYDSTSGSLQFYPGQTSQTFTIQTTDDSDAESAETVNVSLSSPGGADLDSSANGTLTIADNDGGPPPGATLSVSSDSPVAEGGQMLVTISLSQAVDHEVTVHYETDNGTATSSDYLAVSADAVFAAWQSSVTIPIQTNDNTDVGDKDFHFWLSNPNGADLGSPTDIDIVIADDDGAVGPPTIELDADPDAMEGGSLGVFVWLSQPTDHDVTASLVIAGDPTGLARWQQTQISVLIPANQQLVSLSLATIDDSLLNGDESFTISLVSPSGADLGQDSSTPVTLDDNDSGLTLTWDDSGPDGQSAFNGTLYATDSGNGSLDADGTDVYGQAFHAHSSTDDATGLTSMDVTVQGVPPSIGHLTGTAYGLTGGMGPESEWGGGTWTVQKAAPAQVRQCGTGADPIELKRSDFGGSITPIGGYHQQWFPFRLVAKAPACGVIVIQRVIGAATATTVPGGTQSFTPAAYYEVLGRIPAGQTVLQGVIDNWGTNPAAQPTNGPTVTNMVITEDGFAVAYEDDAAAEAAVAGWQGGTYPYATIGDRTFSLTSGVLPSSTTFNDAGLQVFADEDNWHHLRFEYNFTTPPPRETRTLTVDGNNKK
jgi:hypothetical protein